MKQITSGLALTTLLLWSTARMAVAQVEDLGLSGRNTLRYGWGSVLNGRQETDRIYREEILDLDLSWRTLRLNMAVAALQAAELPDARAEADRIKDADLIRRSLEWNGPVNVQLGHFWTTFGNGLALSLYRDDALENPRLTGTTRKEMPTTWDSRGDGLFAEALRGDWTIRALWGETDYAGRLVAGNLEWVRPWGSVGGSYVRAGEIPENIQDRVPRELDLDSREFYFNANLGPVEFSLNHVDQHQYDDLPRTAGAGGLATYGSANLPLLGWNVMTEYKYYRFARRTLYINNPPIVQKEIPTRLIARKRRLNIFEDETGLQLDLSRSFEGGHQLAFSGAWASHIDDSLLPKLEEGLNGYQEYTAGWQMEFSPERHLSLGAAYAEETNGYVQDGPAKMDRAWYRRSGLTAGMLMPVPLLKSMELAGEYMRKTDLETDVAGNAFLLWANIYPAQAWSLNLTADYEAHSDAFQDWMGSGELRTDFHFPRGVTQTLTIFAGRLRGGLVCSSGNCRIVAPFSGMKLTLASQF